MKLLALTLILMYSTLGCRAQQLNGIVKDSATHKVLDYVSVVVYNEKKQPLCFQQTNEKGKFSIDVPEGKKPSHITFTILGYAKKTYSINRFKNGQTIMMSEAETQIKEVTIKSKRLQLRTDTLIYSVAGFRQKQDRSIADVIAKMPGLEVSENGGITYQGKPINKFYIEGMDLMGGKYAMASENISADKVKNVEVYQNHQPIKTLKNIQFSDQAALNIVLNDDAKGIWSGTLDMGMGGPLQNGMGAKWLRDGRIIGMRFDKKTQCIAMYKWNNTGKDIKHEILDLSRESRLSGDPNQWVSSIRPGNNTLQLHRYNFNDTHILATNWLTKLGKDQELRLQSSYLHDKTIGQEYINTIYTNIDGQPVIEEENNINDYRNELNTELEYRKNSNKNYIKNLFRSSFEWNNDHSVTSLNGKEVLQDVRPHRAFVGDDLHIIRNLGNNKAFSLKAIATYQKLPSKLLLLNGETQKLDITEYYLNANTTFRHKIFGFNISYEAGITYNRQEASLAGTNAKHEYMEERKGMIAPNINYTGLDGLNVSAACPLTLTNYVLTAEKRTRLYVNPMVNLTYKFTATTQLHAGYRYSNSQLPFSMTTNIPYYNNYITMACGNGKIAEIKSNLAWGTFEYGDPTVGLFYNLSVNYTNNAGMPLFTSWMEGDIYRSKISDQQATNSLWTLATDISKSMGFGKLTLNIGVEATVNNYEMLISENKTPYQSRYFTANFGIAVMPSTIFSLEEKSKYHYSKQINKEDHSANSQSLRSFEHELNLFFMPGKWQLDWKHELYHSNDKSVSTSLFSDIILTYKAKRYECSLSFNNLYGTKEFKRRYIGSNYIEYSINQLRRREILCKVSLYL